MQAVVLVGGFGTRLRPLTSTIPKQLLPVAGVPIIERVLEHLAGHGVDRAVLSMGYLPEPFTTSYPEGAIAGIEVTFAIEPTPLGTAGAIRFAARHAGVAETFLAVNADCLTDRDVSALVARHRSLGAEGTVALTPVDEPSAYGVVVTDSGSRVTEFVEKPSPGSEPSNEINAGLYVLEPAFLERVAPDGPVSIERETFPAMVADGTLYAVADDAYWIDTGTPSAYLRANTDVLDGTRELAHPGSLADGVLVLEGATVASSASVRRSVLSEGSIVGDDAIVEGSVLLRGAVVGAGASVRDSIVGPTAAVGKAASLTTHCVVAESAKVEPGSTLERAKVER